MTEIVQIDLFTVIDPEPLQTHDHESILNGMYYEQNSDKFVSFVLGRRHFEVSPGQCLGDKEWKEKTKRERVI